MKKNKAIQLVEALRSGEYSQGRGYLVDNDDNFCCLGVACNISKVDLEWTVRRPNSWQDCGWAIGNESSHLPKSIQEEFGFYSSNGMKRDESQVIIDGRDYESLADANDCGCTFNEIADYIEQNYKEL